MSALPHATPPSEPTIEGIPATVDSYPEAPESAGPELSAHEPFNADVPGPSSTFIPREPSPPLPNIKSRSFPAADAASEEDDDDDEVLATLPVYLSPAMYPHLDMYQYPLQHRSIAVPSWARDRGKTISARVKEKVGRVEVEIPVDAGTSYWREDRARDLNYVTDVNREMNGDGDDTVEGYGFGGRSKDKEKEKKGKEKEKKKKDEKWGDKMRLTSESVPNATGYYSGVIRDGALHLHPISKLLQFRTSLNYLDDADARQRDRASRRANGGAGGDDSDEDYVPGGGGGKKKPPQPVKDLRPVRRMLDEEENDGSGSIKDFRNKMWWLARREEEDQWVPYSWKEGPEDEHVAEALERLVVPEDKRERLECKTRGLDFLDRT